MNLTHGCVGRIKRQRSGDINRSTSNLVEQEEVVKLPPALLYESFSVRQEFPEGSLYSEQAHQLEDGVALAEASEPFLFYNEPAVSRSWMVSSEQKSLYTAVFEVSVMHAFLTSEAPIQGGVSQLYAIPVWQICPPHGISSQTESHMQYDLL